MGLTLAPGWYALVFGAGQFGADIGVTELFMPSLAVDLSPLLAFTAIQVGNPFGTPPQFVYQAAPSRFFRKQPVSSAEVGHDRMEPSLSPTVQTTAAIAGKHASSTL